MAGAPSPSSPTPATAKVCVRCGQDCSRKPRVKDQQGRYQCEECFEKAKADRRAPADHADGNPAFRDPVRPAAPVASAPPPPADDDGPLALIEEETPRTMRPLPCPGCAKLMPPEAMLCVHCGWNKRTGTRGRTETETADGGSRKGLKGDKKGQRKCRECGYDLKGLQSITCPECGAKNLPPTKRDRDREDSARIARMAYIKPTAMVAIGLGCSMAMLASGQAATPIPLYLVYFGLSLVVAFVVYFFCSLMWIGFDEPFHLMALRLAGVYAVTDFTGMVIESIGLIGYPAAMAQAGIFYALFTTTMEIDLEDALLVGLVMMIVKMATFFTILYILA